MYLNERERIKYCKELNKIGGLYDCNLNNFGVFEFVNVPEKDVCVLLNRLKNSKIVKNVNITRERYDFSYIDLHSLMPMKKCVIRGMLNESLD